MKKIAAALILSILLTVSFVFFFLRQYTGSVPSGKQIVEKNNHMKLSSPVFQNNSYIPLKYTCDGDNVNPPLVISNVPHDTKSLVLIIEDPDAPSGLFIHWILYNIDPTTTDIPENSVPKGAQEGSTGFGRAQYGGPCPPHGIHHYHFKLYALNNKLEGLYNPDKETLEHVMHVHIIDQTELVGLYSR